MTSEASTLRAARTLAFSPSAVYAAFELPTELAAWWGPDGFTNSFEIFEFQPGGRWRFVMHGPDGKDYQNECVFEAMDPGRQVVIRHVGEPYFTLTIDLTPVEGGTHLRWAQVFDDEATARAVEHIAGPANEQNIDRLTRVLLAR